MPNFEELVEGTLESSDISLAHGIARPPEPKIIFLNGIFPEGPSPR
jgi:hypothetical protein